MLSPIKRRLPTRAIVIVPAVAVLLHDGEEGVLQLLVLNQVALSLQLPRNIFTDSLNEREGHHGLVCTPDMAAVDCLERRIPDHCARRLAGCASAGANPRARKPRRQPNRMGPRGLVLWNAAGLDHFFAASAYTLTHSVPPEGKKCDTQGRRRQHASCGRRHMSPALTAVTVPAAKHNIGGDTYLS